MALAHGCSKAVMSDWRTRKKANPSQTPGKTKAESCKADAFKKYMARSARSYKDPLYGEWCRQMDALNGRKK